MTKKVILIGKKYKKNMLYNFVTFFYRFIFVNPSYVFRDLGFWGKTKLDLMYKLGVRIEYIKTRQFKIFGDSALWVLYENGYSQLSGCKNVLDLGGYIGDSALELSRRNKKVYVFEPEKRKFSYILKNIKVNNLGKKIIPFNYAVVTNNDKKIKLYSRGGFEIDGAASTYAKDRDKYEEVRCMHIKKVLKLVEFDGLKCDIEGGEWPLIEYFIKNNFDFKKGIFELHFGNKTKDYEVNVLKKFMAFLEKEEYKVFFYAGSSENGVSIKKYLDSLGKRNFSIDAIMMRFSK